MGLFFIPCAHDKNGISLYFLTHNTLQSKLNTMFNWKFHDIL